MTLPLANQTALVTGASRGIGRAIARRLAADGAQVLIHFARAREAADSLAAQIADSGGSAQTIEADLETADGVAEFVAQAASILGERRLDVLVNNAGVAEFASLPESSPELVDRQLAVNVRAPFLVTAGLLDRLADDARIVFTSSVVARAAFDGITAYAMTKGAVNTLVRQLAGTLGPRGIRVNAVAPGAIRTDMADRLFATPESTQAILDIQALKRVGEPEDIAGAVAFLAGPDSRWVTGQVIEVSGGTML